jgi:hypothetical protein
MGKRYDGSKERYWRRLLQQSGRRGETIAQFCARRRVPVHQYYWWQRTLRERDRQSATGSEAPAEGDGSRLWRDASASKRERRQATFVPVRLPFSVSAPIEVVHPKGWVVRVPVGFDPLSLGRILAMLDRPASDLTEK